MTSELLRTIKLHINIDKWGGGFSVFLTFCHTIMSTIAVSKQRVDGENTHTGLFVSYPYCKDSSTGLLF